MTQLSLGLLSSLSGGLPLDPLPKPYLPNPKYNHPPKIAINLTKEEFRLCISNALRYFPSKYHNLLSIEFGDELIKYGHIYMYRFVARNYIMKAYPLDYYPAKSKHAACIQLMIMNNLDPNVAQYPEELITYGGNGSVFNNWAQYHITMKYLSMLSDDETLVMLSGHPQGIYPSNKNSPIMVISNGITIPNYSSKEVYNKLYAMGNTIYGQMTAGSYCYIGPQGIVHGTTITIMNAGRKYLGLQSLNGSGKVYVSSGLGGMSGAQAKAAVICGCIGVIAEVDKSAVLKRYKQGWVQEWSDNLDYLINRIRKAKLDKEVLSIGYHGNIVNLWKRLSEINDKLVDLGSDQTSLHNPFNGGYYPYQLTFSESRKMMASNPKKFKLLVQESLRDHVKYINKLVKEKDLKFWDYGNCFLLESSRANADILLPNSNKNNLKFKYPSYVQDIMGDIFSLGFGPFRWICTSGNENDLKITDNIAKNVLINLNNNETSNIVKSQYIDNIFWIKNAFNNKLVVGSQARILYANSLARIKIAIEFNNNIRKGTISSPIVLSRDHHDVSGTDSPFRETSNIYDGSSLCGDMAVQNFVGDAFRGATWCALHNGGGVGWGEVINGGFGLVLDGSNESYNKLKSMLYWDVNNGISRRAWSGNNNALFQIKRAMNNNKKLIVTLPNKCNKKILDNLMSKL